VGRESRWTTLPDSFVGFGRYTLCVTAPDASRVCKRFRLRERERRLFGSAVRWGRHYPNKGGGLSSVRWKTGGDRLGRRVSFLRAARARGHGVPRRAGSSRKQWEAPRPKGCPGFWTSAKG
jgi:hypothetical protein